jgi:hypothetical protein
MAFDTHYPNRKDKRKPYRKSKAVDRTCRNHGSCSYCEGNRTFSNKKREPIEVPVHTDRVLTSEQMAAELDKISHSAAESVPLEYVIDESKVF